jgi:hypothetical protein
LTVAADEAVGRRLGTVFDEGTINVDGLVEPGAMMSNLRFGLWWLLLLL